MFTALCRPGRREKYPYISILQVHCPDSSHAAGSIDAQKLLFTFSEFGDLQSQYLSGNFDTTSGPKVEAGSYERIAKCIQEELKRDKLSVLFVTDNILEAEVSGKC